MSPQTLINGLLLAAALWVLLFAIFAMVMG
jgi:hypothetical protein